MAVMNRLGMTVSDEPSSSVSSRTLSGRQTAERNFAKLPNEMKPNSRMTVVVLLRFVL